MLKSIIGKKLSIIGRGLVAVSFLFKQMHMQICKYLSAADCGGVGEMKDKSQIPILSFAIMNYYCKFNYKSKFIPTNLRNKDCL